jgi:nitroreductase
VIYAATRASSPRNSQEWDFVVVRNPETKQKIRDLLAPRFKAMRAGNDMPGFLYRAGVTIMGRVMFLRKRR